MRLRLNICAYCLDRLLRRLALPSGIQNRSLTSLQQLVKTGPTPSRTRPVSRTLVFGAIRLGADCGAARHSGVMTTRDSRLMWTKR